MKNRPIYTTSAKEAFALELRKMQAHLSQLREKMEETIGNGVLPDSINWADVGSARQINQALWDALRVQI
jgi:hypothetical protein